MSGAPARVNWHFGLSCPVELVTFAGDCSGNETLFAVACEPADLEAVQATDTVIAKAIIVKNVFMMTMMPEHLPFVISQLTPFHWTACAG